MTNESLLLSGITLVVVLLGAVVVYRFLRGDSVAGRRGSVGLRSHVDEYRQEVVDLASIGNEYDSLSTRDINEDWQNAVDAEPERIRGVTLDMKLRYADLAWMPTYMVGLLQVLISLCVFAIAYAYLRTMLQILALCLGPLIVNGWINFRIAKRVKQFDADFAQFLLSVVGMLKTGLNPVQALEAAVDSLEEESLVRQEVELMLERVRMGVAEDRSIGAFGEDIDQPEIELFVQALLLSKRVGGTLSDTLDRLAKQIRKRQNFKLAANGAVSMQRGSIYAIIAVIAAVQVYMYFIAPAMVVGAWTHPKLAGWAQGSIVIVFSAIMLINKLTNIKI